MSYHQLLFEVGDLPYCVVMPLSYTYRQQHSHFFENDDELIAWFNDFFFCRPVRNGTAAGWHAVVSDARRAVLPPVLCLVARCRSIYPDQEKPLEIFQVFFFQFFSLEISHALR